MLSTSLFARSVLDITEGVSDDDQAAAAQTPWPSDHLGLVAEVMLPSCADVVSCGTTKPVNSSVGSDRSMEAQATRQWEKNSVRVCMRA